MACRRELVEYDHQQREAVSVKGQGSLPSLPSVKAKEVSSFQSAAARRETEGWAQKINFLKKSFLRFATCAVFNFLCCQPQVAEFMCVIFLFFCHIESGVYSDFPFFFSKASNCFGCASAAVEHCITLLRALVTNPSMRQILCSQVRHCLCLVNNWIESCQQPQSILYYLIIIDYLLVMIVEF